MPEYLAPGVYVEETSFRSKSIEGVSTTTTGFVGPTRYGPVTVTPDVVTSLGEFERIYAGGGQLAFRNPLGIADNPMDNFLWHGVRAFFNEGGKRLYVSRVFRPLDPTAQYPMDQSAGERRIGSDSVCVDGHARPASPERFPIRSRFPGAASNLIVTVTLKAGQNLLGGTPSPDGGPPLPKLGAILDGDLVFIERRLASPLSPLSPTSPLGPPSEFARTRYDPVHDEFQFWTARTGAWQALSALGLNSSTTPGEGDAIVVVTATVQVNSEDGEHDLGTWTLLPLDPNHQRAGVPDSIFDRFSEEPATITEARTLPIIIDKPASNVTALDFLRTHFGANLSTASVSGLQGNGIPKLLVLTGGNDGQRPGSGDYEGRAVDPGAQSPQSPPLAPFKTGLKQFEDIDDISIVAAPGCTADYPNFRDNANAIIGQLITHAQQMRYRIAVLDSPPKMGIADIRRVRAKLDSSYAAIYYPWVTVLDPITRAELNLPPSGFVSGIYARNDINRAVYKAPANEVVNLAIGFEHLLNKSQQDVLNPEGINCFRFFEGRGFRLWGARTISSDPEWKYVNLRRYFAYLEHSIDKGTQWAVFEPNGEALWANVRRTIEDFLLNEFQSGALLGDKPEKAYFVKCDRSTMTQNDLDNGRLVCQIGVAALRPAEFVIFRIGQWTADRKP